MTLRAKRRVDRDSLKLAVSGAMLQMSRTCERANEHVSCFSALIPTKGCYYSYLAVLLQAWLKEMCDGRITEWNMSLLAVHGVEYIAQRGKAPVDALGFLE